MDLFFSGLRTAAARNSMNIALSSAFILFSLLSASSVEAQSSNLNQYNPVVKDTIVAQGGVEYLAVSVQVAWSPDLGQDFESAEIELSFSNGPALDMSSLWSAVSINTLPGNSFLGSVNAIDSNRMKISISRSPGQDVQDGVSIMVNLGVPADSFPNEWDVVRVGGIIIWENVAFKTSPFDSEPSTSVELWPHPASDWAKVNVEGENSGRIRLFDLQGRLAYYSRAAIALPASLPVSNLTQGSYLLQIELSGATTITKRFMKH